MVPESPADALGTHSLSVRNLLVKVIRARHSRSAEGHQASESRYAMGFGTQWRDLLDDVQEALKDRGHQTHKLAPAGYTLPVVNACLIYVWRIPAAVNAVSLFATSPTRMSSFSAPLPPPMLFEPNPMRDPEPVDAVTEEAQLERMVRAAGNLMPLVLVMVQSSPRQLQSIEWAVAELDQETGMVKMHGRESIWETELKVAGASNDVESFDSGTPTGPSIEPREREGTEPDA